MASNPFGPQAKWIAMADVQGTHNAPLLRREFRIEGSVQSATLMIVGLGCFEASINGRRVGDHLLDPAQTDYDRRILYVVHDVTGLLQPGANTIGVMLGDGWFNQNRVWQATNARYGIKPGGAAYGTPRLLAELHVESPDGGTQVISSDSTWTTSPGPVTESNVYAGESYDARLEQPGWDCPGFDDSAWRPAISAEAPCDRLERQDMPPIRCTEELRPVAIREVAPGQFVVDMGQNFSGWARIRIDGPAGCEVRMRFAESVGADGHVDTASTGVFATEVEQVDRFICDGEGARWWEPSFTYHGFRYVEITGWPGRLEPDDIIGAVVHTDLPVAGRFECSDERLNTLHRMAVWTHRSNIHGLPEDCPARERCGWLGDANVVAEFSMWNYHGKAFWEKYLGDIETTRCLHGGLPCNVAPGKRTAGTANPDWAAAFILLPWYVYQYYGDREVLRKHWDGMQTLIEHFGRQANAWILEGGYGDWFDPGGKSICQHTPPTLTTSLWFLRCAEIMAASAALQEKHAEAARYGDWAGRIREAIVARFYQPAMGSFGSQAADAMALAFEVVRGDEADRAFESLVADIHARDNHLNVGIMGLRFLFEVLTRRGRGDLALAILHQDTYPSFGDLIGRGATTLWEWWGEPEYDILGRPRSMNHPMMGGYDNWFFNTLAGIRIDPLSPGFAHFHLEPHPIPGVDWIRAYHDGPHGRIESRWTFTGNRFEWTAVVPQGCRATATLPLSGGVRALKAGTHRIIDEPAA